MANLDDLSPEDLKRIMRGIRQSSIVDFSRPEAYGDLDLTDPLSPLSLANRLYLEQQQAESDFLGDNLYGY